MQGEGQFSHRKSTLVHNARHKSGSLLPGAKQHTGAESAPAQSRGLMPNHKIAQGTKKLKKEFGAQKDGHSAGNVMAQSHQNFENGLAPNNLQRAIQTQKMQKKNEVLHGKHGAKSGKQGCPAPLGPASAHSLEM